MYKSFTQTVQKQETLYTTFCKKATQSLKLVGSLIKFMTGFNAEDVTDKLTKQVKKLKLNGTFAMVPLIDAMIAEKKAFDQLISDGTNKWSDAVRNLFMVLSKLFGIINTFIQTYCDPEVSGKLMKWMNIAQSVLTIITNIVEYFKKSEHNIYEKWIFGLKFVQPVFVIVYMIMGLAEVPKPIQGQIEIYGNLITITIDHVIISLQMKLVFLQREKMFDHFANVKIQLRKEKCDMEQEEFSNIKQFMTDGRQSVASEPLAVPADFHSNIGKYCRFSPRTCLNIHSNKDIQQYGGAMNIFSDETLKKLHSHNAKGGPITDFSPSISYFNDDELRAYGYKIVKRKNNMNMNNLLRIRNGKLNHIIMAICVQYLDARGQPLNPAPTFEKDIIKKMAVNMPGSQGMELESTFVPTSCREWIDQKKSLASFRTVIPGQINKSKLKEHQIRISYFANLIYVSQEIHVDDIQQINHKYIWLKKLQLKKIENLTLSDADFKSFNVNAKIKKAKDIELPEIHVTFIQKTASVEDGIIFWSDVIEQESRIEIIKKIYNVDKQKINSSINSDGFTEKYCNDNCVNKQPILNPNSCLRLYATDEKYELLSSNEKIKNNCLKCNTQIDGPNHYLTTGSYLQKDNYIISSNGKYSFGMLPDGKTIKIRDRDICTDKSNPDHTDYEMYKKSLSSIYDGLYFSKDSLYALKFNCQDFINSFNNANNIEKENLWNDMPWEKTSPGCNKKKVERQQIWNINISTLQNAADSNNKINNTEKTIVENKYNYLNLSDNAKLEILNIKYQLLWALENEDNAYKELTNKMLFLSVGDYIDSKFAIENNIKLESNKYNFALKLNSKEETQSGVNSESEVNNLTWLQFKKGNTFRDKRCKMAMVENSPLRLVMNRKGFFRVFTYNNKKVPIRKKNKSDHQLEEIVQAPGEAEPNSRIVVTTCGTLQIFNTKNNSLKVLMKMDEIEPTTNEEIKVTDFAPRNHIK